MSKLRFILQATDGKGGWQDISSYSTLEQAEKSEKALVADGDKWEAAHHPPENMARLTRIVPQVHKPDDASRITASEIMCHELLRLRNKVAADQRDEAIVILNRALQKRESDRQFMEGMGEDEIAETTEALLRSLVNDMRKLVEGKEIDGKTNT